MFSLLGDDALGSLAGGNGAKNGDELDMELSVGESNGGGLNTRLCPDSCCAHGSDVFFSAADAVGVLAAASRAS